VLANAAGDVITYVDGVRKDVTTVIADPPDVGKILKNSGPTNANYGIDVSEVKRDNVSLFRLAIDVPVIWDVTIGTSTVIAMNQAPVTLQTLNVSGHLVGNGGALTINEDFSNSGIVESFGGSFSGNFTNSGMMTIVGSLTAQKQFVNTGSITIQQNGSL
jgi:hypothetical protein